MSELNQFVGQEISLSKFLECIGDKPCYKLLSINGIQRGFKYEIGVNEDTNEFNPTGSCKMGGLYFFVYEQLVSYESFTRDPFYIAKVDMSKLLGHETVRIYVEDGKVKANKIYIEKPVR